MPPGILAFTQSGMPIHRVAQVRIGHNRPPLESELVLSYKYIVKSFFAFIHSLSSPKRRQLLKAITSRIERMEASEFPGIEYEALVFDIERKAYIPPPKIAPELFDKSHGLTASEFLLKTYGSYVRAGAIYQRNIRNLDHPLMIALEVEFRGNRDGLRKLLPPVKEQTDRVVEGCAIRPPTRAARSAIVKAMGVR